MLPVVADRKLDSQGDRVRKGFARPGVARVAVDRPVMVGQDRNGVLAGLRARRDYIPVERHEPRVAARGPASDVFSVHIQEVAVGRRDFQVRPRAIDPGHWSFIGSFIFCFFVGTVTANPPAPGALHRARTQGRIRLGTDHRVYLTPRSIRAPLGVLKRICSVRY